MKQAFLNQRKPFFLEAIYKAWNHALQADSLDDHDGGPCLEELRLMLGGLAESGRNFRSR